VAVIDRTQRAMRVSGALDDTIGQIQTALRTGVKRGWTGNDGAPGQGIKRDDDFAGLPRPPR